MDIGNHEMEVDQGYRREDLLQERGTLAVFRDISELACSARRSFRYLSRHPEVIRSLVHGGRNGMAVT
jgi:hypothetical protein